MRNLTLSLISFIFCLMWIETSAMSILGLNIVSGKSPSERKGMKAILSRPTQDFHSFSHFSRSYGGFMNTNKIFHAQQ